PGSALEELDECVPDDAEDIPVTYLPERGLAPLDLGECILDGVAAPCELESGLDLRYRPGNRFGLRGAAIGLLELGTELVDAALLERGVVAILSGQALMRAPPTRLRLLTPFDRLA